ncbi:hypothetical protein OGAPHI_002207 [Ogataea philodendri]|uniref:BSD domain-containing protein n=1 Tax=Ogataea philodendri TaxID=1378263 RepID=A0A9P8PA22_9ASCO|nr:uncharacterized protein OGAPHI_002207 [Ogataea philodendri]KAH3668453.1 hypothetical protein OGAPHI_002207 [Ogataea philodendri]
MEYIEAETQEGEHKDQKTEQLVNELEEQVEKVYNNIETQTVSGWNTFSGFFSSVQKKLPDYLTETKELAKNIDLQKTLNSTRENFEKNLSNLQNKFSEEELKEIRENSSKLLQNLNENTNKYLDDLDQDLEKIENVTLGYASKLGSLLASKTGLNLGGESEVSGDKKDEVLFNMPQNVATNRLEAQLHELENNKDLYLSNAKDETVQNYTLSPEEETEKTALANKENIKTLYEQLVPGDIEGSLFWKIFFSTKSKILEEEKKRKEMLEKKPADDDEEDFDWDDDDDEEKKDESEKN